MHVHRIMEFNDSKNNIHGIECSVRPYPGTDPKFRTSCSRNMTTNLRTNCFKIYKMQTKFENHETCRDVMISYVEDVIKIWEGLVHVITYDAYKPGHLHMWYQIKWNKLTKYSKQFRKCTKFRHGVPSTVRGLQKKFGGQNTKKN